MPTIINTAEGGTNGTTVTTTNTGGGASGDAASTVTLGSGNTIIFSNAVHAHGALSYQITYGATSTANIMWDIAESGRLVHSFYVNVGSLPAATEYLGGIRHASGYMCLASIGSDGKFIMQNAASAGISASRAANTFPVNQQVRVEIAVTKGTTTTDGTIEYAYYLGDSATAIASWSSNTQNTGTANVARVMVGRSTAGTETRTTYYDTIRAQSLASGWIGPYSTTSTVAIINTAEGGTNGAVPTTGNTGGASGDAASLVTLGSGNTLLFTNYTPAHGNLGYEFNYGTTSNGHMRWAINEPNRLVFSFYVVLSTLPTAADYIASVRNATGNMCIVTIGTDGKLIIQNAASAGISASRAANVFPIQRQVRVEIGIKKGTTTSDGTIEYAYYLGDSTTAEATWSSSTQNTGTTDIAIVQIGRNTAATEARTMWFDTIRAQTTLSGWLGPYTPPNQLPIARLGGNVIDIEPYTQQLVSGLTSSDFAPGNIAEYVFRQVSGSPVVTLTGTGGTRSYKAPGTISGADLTFGLVVIDNQGGSSVEDTVVHTILPASERAVVDGLEVPMEKSTIINGV